MERRGLLVFVYRAAEGTDCTAGGITSKVKNIILIGQNICGPFKVKEGETYLELVEEYCGGRVLRFAIPMVDGHKVYGDDGVTMNGGNFIYDHDDRFPADYPIPVRDRFEDWETFQALSV